MCIGPKINAPPPAPAQTPPLQTEKVDLDKSVQAASGEMGKAKKRQGFASTILSQISQQGASNPNTIMGQALKSKLGV